MCFGSSDSIEGDTFEFVRVMDSCLRKFDSSEGDVFKFVQWIDVRGSLIRVPAIYDLTDM